MQGLWYFSLKFLIISYKYKGFWQCMDTKREKDILEELWDSGKAPWKVWDK